MNTKKRLLSIIVLVVFSVACGGCGGGDGGGNESWLYPLWVPTDVVISDIDLDGYNDVLTIAQLSTSMSNKEGYLTVYCQVDLDGSFESSFYIVGKYPWQLVVSDINGDDLPDLLVTDPDLRTTWILLQDPNTKGQFLPPRQISGGMAAYSAAVADFNNDGTADIAIGDEIKGSRRIVMLYQDPMFQGAFLPAVDFSIPGLSSSEIAAGDLNGDGLDDLIAWIYTEPSGYTPNGRLAISFQQPNGELSEITTLAPQTGLNVRHLAIADYNGDGLNDIFVFFTPFSSDYKAKFTVVLHESQTDSFSAPVDTSLSGIKGIDDAVVADLNGDDRPDFAVAGFFPVGSPTKVNSRLNLFLQSGGGTFYLAGVYDMPISVSRLTAGDINNDGLNDLVVLGEDNQCMILTQSQTIIGTFNPPIPL